MLEDFIITDLIIYNELLYRFRNLFRPRIDNLGQLASGLLGLSVSNPNAPGEAKFVVTTQPAPFYLDVQPAPPPNQQGVVMTLSIKRAQASAAAITRLMDLDLPGFQPASPGLGTVQLVSRPEPVVGEGHTFQVRVGTAFISITHDNVV